ncbi:MAG TPA: hypothetical protein VM262_19840, partial [Acidimicrobiales bacterium]|nr:hypothetical protein [Acidimicrobiales bacterium]
MTTRTHGELAAERDRLTADLDRLTAEMTALHDRNADRALSAGDKQRWENLKRGVERIKAQLAEVDTEQRELVLNQPERQPGDDRTFQAPGVIRHVEPWQESPPRDASEARDRALAAVEARHDVLGDATAERITALVDADRDAERPADFARQV